MCGIAGYISVAGKSDSISTIERMTSSLRSRGPDSAGIWTDKEHGIYLGHRRLSVIDLSENGNQPMHSHTGRYVISFNGEIYNYHEIKNELDKSLNINWLSVSDTEVILVAIESWGITDTINKLIGMFAFAIWDKYEKNLHLIRDRLGKKPLYWGQFNGLFLFASELKALREHHEWRPEINRDALLSYMKHSYVPSPETMYKKIYKLKPGSILTYKQNKEPCITSYWKLDDAVSAGLNHKILFADDVIISDAENIIENAVTHRMISDVPLGVFLSGGIDSSLITALMQKNSTMPVRSFSIGFHERNYNESSYAAEISKYIGTDHTEFYIEPREALEVITEIPKMYDEPFADSSQIPTYLVSKLARQYVTVALTGDGGDEIFAGYNRYLYAASMMKRLESLSKFSRGVIGKIVYSLSPDDWTMLFRYMPKKYYIPNIGDKLYKIAEVIGKSESVTYQKLVTHWNDNDAVVIGCGVSNNNHYDNNQYANLLSTVELMQIIDILTYLPDDILVKLDRASMAVSLEARAPFLDHRVVEFSWKLPLHMKIRNGKGKWLLRQILYKYIPSRLVDRPKAGFSVPIGEWLKGSLRDWAESLLDKNKIDSQGYLNYLPIRKKWDEHISGKRNWQYHLWNVLMFQAWLEKWGV